MHNSNSPAEELRAAAKAMRERAEAASPGPWHQMCMGSEGCQVLNDGHLRERKHVSFSGRKEWKADHADAEYIASMHPLVALAVADFLDAAGNDACAAEVRDDGELDLNWCDEPGTIVQALGIARAYTGGVS